MRDAESEPDLTDTLQPQRQAGPCLVSATARGCATGRRKDDHQVGTRAGRGRVPAAKAETDARSDQHIVIASRRERPSTLASALRA